MTTVKILFVGLLLSAGSSAAMAQTAPARSPVNGDAVTQTAKPVRPRPATRAARDAQADKQPPGTENGNQPDRAQAGGGAR